MFGKVDSIKLLKTLIKFSAVALTSPATIAVAGSLYPDNLITRLIVSAAALVLVEGCLLLGWQMLDSQGKHATMAQRWLYAGLAWVAYLSLFGVALYHNEGVAGLTFRLTLGVMLVYASAEAGLLASVKLQKQAEKDILKDWRVKRYARKLARRSAMADLDLGARMRQLDREAQQKLYTLCKERETSALSRVSSREMALKVKKLSIWPNRQLFWTRQTRNAGCRNRKHSTKLYRSLQKIPTRTQQKLPVKLDVLDRLFTTT